VGRRRSIRGLQQALLIEPPSFLSNSYRSPAMLQGIRFEKKIKKYIDTCYQDAEILKGQWFQFEDIRGRGFAQPDIILLSPESLIIVEVKLTWRPEVERKLRRLYGPLCSEIWPDLPQKHAQVCKGLRDNCPVENWFDIEDMFNPENPSYVDVHFL